MEQEYFTVKEAAKKLNLEPEVLRNYLSDGRIKGKKIFNSTVVSKEEIDRYNKLREDAKE